MKVYDVLTESKQVDEGPIRFLKRTLEKTQLWARPHS